MGRHSASYIAARHTPSSGTTTAGAAKYVGRVGAFALALGVGAAVAGGTGLAHAEDTTDNRPGNGDATQSSPDAAKGGPAGSSSDTEPVTISGGALTEPQPIAEAEPDSLGGLIARIPSQLAAVFGNGRTPGANSPTHAVPEPQDSPEGNRPNGHPAGKTRPTTADDPAATFSRASTDNLSTALRDTQQLGVVPSPVAATTRQQRSIAPSFVTATPQSAIRLTAPAQAVQVQPAPQLANPIATVVSSVLRALGFSPSASAGGSPASPIPFVLGALQLLSREIERIFLNQAPSTASFVAAETYANAHPATAPGVPTPGDEVHTAYGDVGKWMLEPDGQISDYGGQPYQGKALLEAVNVIIVDPTSKTPTEASERLNAAMLWAGFPAQPIHSTGFQGSIDDVIYGQEPTGILQGYSNGLFVLPNDHGRFFGPDPVETSTGYVWSGAFSTETLGIYNFLPAHTYVSSDMARAALATQLIRSGQATFVGMVPLDNAYNTETTTTGDHDGYAVVLQLKN